MAKISMNFKLFVFGRKRQSPKINKEFTDELRRIFVFARTRGKLTLPTPRFALFLSVPTLQRNPVHPVRPLLTCLPLILSYTLFVTQLFHEMELVKNWDWEQLTNISKFRYTSFFLSSSSFYSLGMFLFDTLSWNFARKIYIQRVAPMPLSLSSSFLPHITSYHIINGLKCF